MWKTHAEKNPVRSMKLDHADDNWDDAGLSEVEAFLRQHIAARASK